MEFKKSAPAARLADSSDHESRPSKSLQKMSLQKMSLQKVDGAGVEPATPEFSVQCSTN